MINKKYIKKYNLKLEAITLLSNFKLKNGLSSNEKKLFKSIQRYFDKIQNFNLIPSVGDVVISESNIEYYRSIYSL